MNEPINLEVSFKPQPERTLRGFTMDWISAKTESGKIELMSGAGCGNPYLEIRIKDGEHSQTYEVDMRPVVQQVFDEHSTRNVHLHNSGEKK